MILKNIILISVTLGIVYIGLEILVRYINSLFNDSSNSKNSRIKLNWKDELLFGLTIAILFYIVFYFFSIYGTSSKSKALLGLFLFLTLVNSYNFLLRPLIRQVVDRKYVVNPTFERWIRNDFDPKIRLKSINDEVINAYSVGVLPFTKTILIGKPLLENMNSNEIKCIILHELGHLKNNDLLILFLTAVMTSFIWSYAFVYILPLINIFKSEAVTVAILGGFLGGTNFFLMGIVQRFLEYRADVFSARRVGSKSYTKALSKLNQILDGKMNKDSIHHPTLTKRIANVQKFCE